MANRLATETSPYLLQHADNPVDWWPWGADAFAEARATGKPILLSIGYAACHWCHVMAHESFENPDIAEVMNRLFINIKVDREERPDVDQIYMAALHGLGEQGGWPLTMFLTSDAVPFWGGTYFPPTPRYGRPGFRDVAETIARIVKEGDPRVATNQKALMAQLANLGRPSPDKATPTEEMLTIAAERLAGMMDNEKGGLRGAPKFPQPGLLDLLLTEGARSGNPKLTAAACFALERMSQGGIYDHVGGGYSRYSVDDRWLVPHFEKMLYDNAEIIRLLGKARRQVSSGLFQDRISETIDWLVRDMLLPEGAFAASLDADTEGHEGATYVWTVGEVASLLGNRATAFMSAYDVTPEGNFEGKSILNRLTDRSSDRERPQSFLEERQILLEVRSLRPQPGRDNKILADWNGLMIAALADLNNPDWVDLAATAYHFVSESMADPEGRLAHSTRNGRFARPGLASDHAAFAVAALALFKATQQSSYLDDARRFLEIIDQHYAMGNGLFYLTADDCADLIVRPSSLADEASPNYHAHIAKASTDLYLLTGDETALARTDKLFDAAGPTMARNPLATASLYTAFARRLDLDCVVIVGRDSAERTMMLDVIRETHPEAVHFVTESAEHLGPTHPAYGKKAIQGKPTVYICRAGTCQPPIIDPTQLTG